MDVQNFQDTFETRKPSCISDFLICMTVTLRQSAFRATVIDLLITTSLYN